MNDIDGQTGTEQDNPFANHDAVDLPDVPANLPSEPLDALAERIGSLDDATLASKIGSRSSPMGKVIFLAIVLGAGGLGVFAWNRSKAFDHRWDVWTSAQAAPSRDEFLRIVREDLPRNSFDDVREQYMMKIAEYRDVASVPALTTLLAEKGSMRAHAARALARIGSPAADSAKATLLAALPSCTPADRAPVVWALAVLGEAQASDAVIEEFTSGTLQGQAGFDPNLIAHLLGTSRLASPQLTGHASAAVRTLVAQALSEAATPEVILPLVSMIQSSERMMESQTDDRRRGEEETLIRQAVQGLGRVADARAAEPLFALMTRHPNMRATVLDALKRSTGARGLAVLLTSATDAQARKDLTFMLRATHDPAAADALASMLTNEDEDVALEAARGLADVGDQRALPVLLRFAGHENLSKGRDALDSVAVLGAPTAATQLSAMLREDRFVSRRAQIMKAIGRTGSAGAADALIGQLTGDDVGTAALALAELNSESGYTALMRMVPRPRNVDFSTPSLVNEVAFNNRTAAVRALGRYGRPTAAAELIRIIEDPADDARLRSDAGLALGACADETVLREVLTKIKSPALDDAARRYYFAALWQNPTPALSSDLLELIQNPATPPDVRIPAGVALGYIADSQNDTRLVAMLDAPATTNAAAIAIAVGGGEQAATRLLAKLDGNSDLRDVLQQLLMNQENDWFNLVTSDLWQRGAVYQRLRVAQILNQGDGDNRHGYAWSQLINRLKLGWGGVRGMSAGAIRQALFADLRGAEAGKRELAAQTLGAMSEVGLLMAARDATGPGSAEARAILLQINRPDTNG